jgi:glycosyltransferase involved in cell wall biosynthesis
MLPVQDSMSHISSRKRIAMLVPGGVGGEQSGMHLPALQTLIEKLAQIHDLHVYSLAPPNWGEPTGSCGNAQVRFFPVQHKKGTLKKFRLLANACCRDHRLQPFDIVHGFWAIPCGATAVVLGKYLRVPSVVNFLGGETACLPQIPYGNMSRCSTKMVTLWVSKYADELTALTHDQAGELRKAGCVRHRVNVIPFGADTHLFPSGNKDITTRPLRMLHVANIHAVKDQPTLMRVFQVVSQSVDARLRIIGADQTGGSIQQLAVSMNLADRVEFLGYIPQRELSLHYLWAHILVHTSLHEAQGAVMGEAAASGVLVAGTRTGLIADFGDELALASGVGDYQGLSNGILSVVANPQRYDSMRLAAQQWALAHDLQWTVQQYLDVYEKAMIQ